MSVEFICTFTEYPSAIELDLEEEHDLELDFEKVQTIGSSVKVPEWAMQEEKPTYTADEVRALSLEPQQLSDVELDNVRTNMKAIGLSVEGKMYMPYTVDEGNDYA